MDACFFLVYWNIYYNLLVVFVINDEEPWSQLARLGQTADGNSLRMYQNHVIILEKWYKIPCFTLLPHTFRFYLIFFRS